jgi:hypothetical protein
LKNWIKKFYKILKPAGSILLDLYSFEAFQKRTETAIYKVNLLDGFWSPNKYYGFLNTFKYKKEKVVLDKYTIVESDRIRTVYNWLQYFSPEDLQKEFNESDLSISEFYSDVIGTPFDRQSGEFAVVANKSKG